MRQALILVAAGVAALAGAQPNLLQNAGCEQATDGQPAAWSFENWKMGGVPGVTDGVADEGRSAASVTCATDQERGAWRQIVRFQGPRYVYFSAWYKTSFAGPASGEVKGAVVRFLFFRDVWKWDHPWILSFAAPPNATGEAV